METWHFEAAKDFFFSTSFSPSEHLQHLRVARRQTVKQHLRKDLSLHAAARVETVEIKSVQRLLGQPKPVERFA